MAHNESSNLILRYLEIQLIIFLALKSSVVLPKTLLRSAESYDTDRDHTICSEFLEEYLK